MQNNTTSKSWWYLIWAESADNGFASVNQSSQAENGKGLGG